MIQLKYSFHFDISDALPPYSEGASLYFFVVDIPDYDFNIAEACHIEIKHTLPLQSNYKVITKFSPPPYVGK